MYSSSLEHSSFFCLCEYNFTMTMSACDVHWHCPIVQSHIVRACVRACVRASERACVRACERACELQHCGK